MFLLELNEFNVALLRRVAEDNHLANISRVLDLPRSTTNTPDRDESGYLEPWVQWVSVHTGEPASTHCIKHLGDVPDLQTELLWQALGKAGVSTGIWGVMNGARRDAPNNLFFLPDPWTFTEPAYPDALAPLLELPRYLARSYLDISKCKVTALFGSFLSAAIGAVGWRNFLGSLSVLADGFRAFGGRHLVFIAWFEYVSGLACLRYYERTRPDFCLLFVNTLAHVQHHYWLQPETGSREIAFGARMTDRLIGRIFAALPAGTPLIVANALAQRNTGDEPAWYLYRPKDPEAFIRAVGLNPISVEPLMTHDAHLRFADAAACARALTALYEARVNGERAFYVEPNATDPNKLFYRLEFTGELAPGAQISVNGQQFDFLTWFQRIVRRTGRHVPAGAAFASGIELPSKFENRQLFNLILAHFGIGDGRSAAPAPQAASSVRGS